ncbi:S8 family serine peptidase [Metabacillus herbersteinensis]|uniref:S8 family serine peptidase n=1 Tax=Metabacillus herbersteinensis TaxID=283816 RepID=A0ABV6GH89_9BACI
MIKRFITQVILVFVIMFGLTNGIHTQALASNQLKIESKLFTLLEETELPVEVIIHFNTSTQNESKAILKSVGIEKGILLNKLPLAGTVATKKQVEQLAKSQSVQSIYYNQKLQYENADATRITGVDQVRTDSTFMKTNKGLPITGKGIGVLINDSGVDGTHQDLEFKNHLVQNVTSSLNLHALSDLLPITYVEDVPNTDSNSGHGTHVAGIVGGTGEMSGGKHEGVAPGADLIGYGSGAGLAIMDTLGAFDYALTHQFEYNIRVITNSWGDTSEAGLPFDPNHPINIATKNLFDRGILTVFSAGNSGSAEGTISGNYKKAPWVVTVAAGTKTGGLTSFSSRGKENVNGTVVIDGEEWTWLDQPTVTAPGENITSTRVISPIPVLGVVDDAEFIEPAYMPFYTTMSGTSMAAPHVAGIAALLFEANPTLSPLEMKEILETTSTPMDYEPWEVGSGYVNAYNAVKMAYSYK